MAEETLRYKIVVDDASLMSELARTRGAITGVLQQAISTGQYAVNSLQSDLALTRQILGGPPAPTISRPGQELGFYQASLGVLGAPPPPNMLSFEFQRMAQMEMEGRMIQGASAVGREAIPVGAALLGGLGGIPGMAAGWAAGRLAGTAIFNDLETRSGADVMMNLVRAPHPMRQFNSDQRGALTGGLMEDVARDARFGVQELNQLLAGGQSIGMFSGATNVEEFRGRFRNMMEQVKSITRVFQETTQEAIGTLGQFTQMGVGTPGQMQGRIADVLSLQRMSGMSPNQALQIGQSGAQMAAAQGATMAGGYDFMMRNAMMATAAEATQAIDPAMVQQMGGVPGVAGFMGQLGFQAARMPVLKNLLAGLANDSMTDIDQAKVRQLISGDLSIEQLRDQAWSRMADPAQRMRYSSNFEQIQNSLAMSGMAAPVLYQFAQSQGRLLGVNPNDVFGQLTQQMGLNPAQQGLALTFGRDGGGLEMLTARSRQLAQFELDMDRSREESRFTNRFGALVEEQRVRFTNAVGEPIRRGAQAVEGFVGNLTTLPARLFNQVDVALGRLVFGGSDVGGPGGTMDVRRVNLKASERAVAALQGAIQTVASRVDFGAIKAFDRLSEDEKDQFEEAAVGTFAPELSSMMDIQDPTKRKEAKEKLRTDMKTWIRTNYGHMMEDDATEANAFADKMLGIEQLADRSAIVSRGLDKISETSAAVQMREYVGTEIPSLLAHYAGSDRDADKLASIGADVAAAWKGRSPMDSYQAMKTLGERAVPLLGRGSAIRERLEVSQMAINQGFLRPGDMELDTGELASIKKQALSAGQQKFIEELEKSAMGAEGHKISADQLFRGVGMGLGTQYPSSTPSAGVGLDPYKWDSTAQVLDRLTGSVNNLHSSAEQLLQLTRAEKTKNAGK